MTLVLTGVHAHNNLPASAGKSLKQLELIHGNDQTREAIEDWHYWVNRGYQFG
jgi:hypothetical protein